jgi:uncharacterized membrane protein YbhN (UPF0104 family)
LVRADRGNIPGGNERVGPAGSTLADARGSQPIVVDHLRQKHKLAALVTLAAVLAFGASLAMVWVAGFDNVADRAFYPHWPWLVAALGGQLVAYVGYIFAYRDVARAEDGTELELPRTAALVSTGFGVFVAAGGFSLDAEALHRAGLSEKEARARVLGLGALEYVVLAPAAAVAAVFVLLEHKEVGLDLTLPWLIGVPLGFAVALLLLAVRKKLRARRGVQAKAGRFLDALELVHSMAKKPFEHPGAFLGITLYWVGDIFCLWACLHGFFAEPPPVAQLVLGYAVGYALTRRTLPLGGAGIVEVLLPFSLGWVGIALAPAVLAVAAYRMINLWLPIIPALAGLPTLNRLSARRDRRRLRRAQEAPQ